MNHVIHCGLGSISRGLLLGAQMFLLFQTLKLCLVSEYFHWLQSYYTKWVFLWWLELLSWLSIHHEPFCLKIGIVFFYCMSCLLVLLFNYYRFSTEQYIFKCHQWFMFILFRITCIFKRMRYSFLDAFILRFI